MLLFTVPLYPEDRGVGEGAAVALATLDTGLCGDIDAGGCLDADRGCAISLSLLLCNKATGLLLSGAGPTPPELVRGATGL